jgi:phage-related protein
MDFDIAILNEDIIEPIYDFEYCVIPEILFNDCRMEVKYIYLDDEERKEFCKVSNEYLIEQIQIRYTNSFDFALYPQPYQPSGSINVSKIPHWFV